MIAMKLLIRTSPSTQPVPFHYQHVLVGAFHKWLGENEEHDQLSLYSLGWLQGGKAWRGKLRFNSGAQWPISAADSDLVQRLIAGIQDDPIIAYGMEVMEVVLQRPPTFEREHRFLVQSPVLVKRYNWEQKKVHYYLYNEPEADALLTETMQNKLKAAGKENLDISLSFDRSYAGAKTKLIRYQGIDIKGSICPIIAKGDPEAIAFAWKVGVGNSTGIGFGALQ
jgi:CRISPR-associated endoribonuclease Cas6